MERHTLTEFQWQRIEPLLPSNGRRGQQWKDHRRVISGIFWILRTGAPWRDLPNEFGHWKTVYERFRRWTREGLFERILRHLQRDSQATGNIDWSIAMIDGSVVRAHRSAAGAPKKASADTASLPITLLVEARAGFRRKSISYATVAVCRWSLA